MKPELTVGVGHWENLQAAVDNGADAVYFGVKDLNLRVGRGKNFYLTDLKKVVDLCHNKNYTYGKH